MRRRDKAGGKAVKTQRRKTLKRRNAPKTARRSSSLATSKETNVARLARERDEALEQLAATSEMLQVIAARPVSSSRCSKRCSRTQHVFARLGSLYCTCTMATPSARLLLLTTRRPLTSNRASATQRSDRHRMRHLGASRARSKSSISPTSVSSVLHRAPSICRRRG